MNKDIYVKKLLGFYSYNFYLDKMPLEIYQDEKTNVKCAVMKSEDSDNVYLVSAGRVFFRETEPPVEVIVYTTKEHLDNKEEAELIKEFHRELMEKEYEDHFNGSIDYPGMFLLNDEFANKFGKVAYALAVRNGGDPVFIEGDDEDCVCYVVSPIFLTKEQYEEYQSLNEEDEDEAFDYLFSLDEDEDCSLLK